MRLYVEAPASERYFAHVPANVNVANELRLLRISKVSYGILRCCIRDMFDRDVIAQHFMHAKGCRQTIYIKLGIPILILLLFIITQIYWVVYNYSKEKRRMDNFHFNP